MPYIFFSYPRQLWDDTYMGGFLKDLAENLFPRVDPPLPNVEDVYYRDTVTTRVGDRWTETLPEALMSCKAFVYIYSPHYFNSDYCGKEYAVFRQRLGDHASKHGSKGLENRLLLPVLWVPPTVVRKPPPVVTEYQYLNDRLGTVYKEKGLLSVIKQKGTYQSEYNKFVDEFSNALI